MRLRHLLIANAALSSMYGLAMLFAPGPMGVLYRVPSPPLDGGAVGYAPIAMIRLVGLMTLAFALVCGLLWNTVEQHQRGVAGALTGYFAIASPLVWAQQHAIWETPFGWITLAFFIANTLAFSAFFFLGRRGGGPQQPPRPSNAGDRVNAARF